MVDMGLIAHGFNAKAILEEELLIVAGIHPAPDPYKGPLDPVTRFQTMMNRAAVRKFIPEDVPAIPLSPEARSASATPSDPPSSSRPRSITPPTVQSYSAAYPQGTPIIDVVTSPEETVPLSTPPSASPIPPPVELTPSSQGKPHLGESSVPPSSPPPVGVASGSFVFPAPVLTPRLNPAAGVFNQVRTVNRSDVESLSTRSMMGLGHFILAQTSTTPAAITAMLEKYEAMRKELEAIRLELQEVRTNLVVCQRRLDEEKSQSVEKENKIRAEVEIFRAQVVEKSFTNLGNLPPDFDFSFLNVRADGFGRIGGDGPFGA
ncbi:hypothetical protein Salat_1940300 [Sesamum alatum]|uniref:Uncharacterized protein n=1 Tax=Sesamum alatum TaxID=300844 RepID=A0AAE2CIN2_9LAMI|nr:hypothetical protein Salat_1940300 [Sesamum alatum]